MPSVEHHGPAEASQSDRQLLPIADMKSAVDRRHAITPRLPLKYLWDIKDKKGTQVYKDENSKKFEFYAEEFKLGRIALEVLRTKGLCQQTSKQL